MPKSNLELLGTFSVAPDHPALAGHFPGDPIVPGSVLLDLATEHLAGLCDEALHAGRLRRLKFVAQIRPEQTVQVHAARVGNQLRFRCTLGKHVAMDGQIDFPDTTSVSSGAGEAASNEQ